MIKKQLIGIRSLALRFLDQNPEYYTMLISEIDLKLGEIAVNEDYLEDVDCDIEIVTLRDIA